MQSRVYVTVGCPSVCPIIWLPHAMHCGGFAAVSTMGIGYRSIATRPALSSKREQNCWLRKPVGVNNRTTIC